MLSTTMVSRLRKLIKDLGLTQNEFAESIGITPGGLSDILRGKTQMPSGSVFKAIEYRYGISGKWLITGEGRQWINSGAGKKASKTTEEISEIENIYGALDRIRQRMLLNFSRTLQSDLKENPGKTKAAEKITKN